MKLSGQEIRKTFTVSSFYLGTLLCVCFHGLRVSSKYGIALQLHPRKDYIMGIPVLLSFITAVTVMPISYSEGLVIPAVSNEKIVETQTVLVSDKSPVIFPTLLLGADKNDPRDSYTNTTLLHPRRLTKLPKSSSKRGSRNNFSRKTKYPYPVESAKTRARTLLGSLNRQNCFAKVLCGLGARPPTTKTDLTNDYVYLMEELLVDDEDEEDENTKKSSGKNKKKNKLKPYTKKDNSDSSPSAEDDEDSPFGFMAEGELASEDPQVLKYVRLEQKRRKYKNDLPKSSSSSPSIFSKRRGKTAHNETVAEENEHMSEIVISANSTKALDEYNTTRLSQNSRLKLKKAKKIARQWKNALRVGKTFGGSRQCRTLFNRCPFDDIQMNEIVTNLKLMMQGKVQPPPSNPAPSYNPVASNNAANIVSSGTQPSGGGSGSKVEIVLHLNQNGPPYHPSYGMNYGMSLGPQFQQQQFQPGFSGMVTQAQGNTQGAPSTFQNFPMVSQLSSAAPIIPSVLAPQFNKPQDPIVVPTFPPVSQSEIPLNNPINSGTGTQSSTTPVPESTTTTTEPTTTEPTTTTGRTAGEEQLLDFLYGVVSFNDSESSVPTLLADQPEKNPFWALANSVPDPFGDDIETPLKVKRRKPPSWNADDDDDGDDSKSSEEVELRHYLKSLRETLKGLAQMNNASLVVEKKIVKSSEEEDSPEGDPLDDDLPFPGIVDEENESEEDKVLTKDKEVNLNSKGKKKKKTSQNKVNPPATQMPLIASTTKRPINAQSPSSVNSEEIFDDDNEENHDFQTSGSAIRGRPTPSKPYPDDDEFEQEDSPENDEENEDEPNDNEQNDDDDDESDNDQQNDDEPNDDQESNDESNDDQENNDESEESKETPKPKKKKESQSRITLKFDPFSTMRDNPEEMSDKEKRKLVALSNALLPTRRPVRPVSPHKLQPPVDTMKEIRMPSIKSVANEFKTVSEIAKSTDVINIDEFAEDSGISPTFPKKTKKNQRPNRIRYQNKGRPTRPYPGPRERDNIKTSIESSEENFFGSLSRGESIELDKQVGSNNQNEYNHVLQSQLVDPTSPLIAVPFNPSISPYPEQQNYNGQFDLFGSMMNIMGMKPVQDPNYRNDEAEDRHPLFYQQNQQSFHSSHISNSPNQIPITHKTDKSTNSEKNPATKGKSDLFDEGFKFTIAPANPKISINIPLDEGIYQQSQEIPHSIPPSHHNNQNNNSPHYDDNDEDSDEVVHDDVQDDEEGGKKKDEGKDKKKGEGEGNKKDKRKTKKKKDKDDEGSTGFSTQFHQQVYPAPPPKETGLWSKIKGVIDNIAGKKHSGETPFVQIGFEDSDSHDKYGDKNHQEHGSPIHSSHSRPNHGPVFHSSNSGPHKDIGDSDEESNEEEEEEEDEIRDEINDEESNENKDEDKKEDINKNTSSSTTPAPTVAQPQTLVPTNVSTTLESIQDDISTKEPIAPKPPRYQVKRNRNKNRTKKKKQGASDGRVKSTVGPPIILFSTTTETVPQTSKSKPPRRRVIYKPPSKKFFNPPGTPLNIPTTSKPQIKKQSQKNRETEVVASNEDDEIEPSSVYFQPGPKGQNIRGKPPIPIDAFHVQSEDMLVDSEENLRSSLNVNKIQHSMEGSDSVEDNESLEQIPIQFLQNQNILGAPPIPIEALYLASEDSTEETRNSGSHSHASDIDNIKRRRRPEMPLNYYGHYSKPGEQSAFTTAVMNSHIFSNHFKQLYTKFQSFSQSFMSGDGQKG